MKKGLIGKVLIIVLVMISAIIVFTNVTALVRESRNVQSVNDAKQVLKTVDAVVNQILFESTGAQRSIDVTIPEGRFVFSGTDDKIKVRIEGVELLKPGTRIEEENVIIQGGGVLDSYESDILNDGQTDLVLENSAVLLAVKKLGNSTNPVSVNTASVITYIKNKQTGINVTHPKSGIFINDKTNSSFGSGYTQLSQQNNVQTGSILLHLNSSANITYDAIFSLAAATDFIELEVKNIIGA